MNGETPSRSFVYNHEHDKNNHDSVNYKKKRHSKVAHKSEDFQSAIRRRAFFGLFGPCAAVIALLVVLQTASFIFLHQQLDQTREKLYLDQDCLHRQMSKLMEEFRKLWRQVNHLFVKKNFVSMRNGWWNMGNQESVTFLDQIEPVTVMHVKIDYDIIPAISYMTFQLHRCFSTVTWVYKKINYFTQHFQNVLKYISFRKWSIKFDARLDTQDYVLNGIFATDFQKQLILIKINDLN